MCGRYTVNTEEEIIEMREIIKEISIRLSKEDDAVAYEGFGSEAYPSCKTPVITQNKEIRLVKWGFEKWDGKGVIFNARRENIMTSKFFSPYLKKGRCIVPANAYFEWERVNNKPADKYKIFAADNKPLFMAGVLKSDTEYAIITQPAADKIKFIHDRMPLLFNEEQMKTWLFDSFKEDLLYACNVDINFLKVA